MGSFVESGDRRIGTKALRHNAAQAATGLEALGVGEGDVIAIMMRNDLAYFEALLGAGLVGAYAVSINWHFKTEEVGFILRDSDAKVLVIHADLFRSCQSSIPEGTTTIVVGTPPEIAGAYKISDSDCPPPEGVLEWETWRAGFEPWDKRSRPARGNITYTSGTTGKPKGVRREALPPEAQKEAGALTELWFGNRPGMKTIVNGPLYHSVVNTYSRATLRSDGSMVLLPRFDPEELLQSIERHKITHLHLVPTMFVRLLRLPESVRQKYDLSSLEYVIHGAAPCPVEVKRQMIEWWGPIIYEYYGATEFGMATRCDSHEWLDRPGTTGQAWPGRIVEIHDDSGNKLPPGEVGEVYVSLGILADFTYHNQDQQRREIERSGLVTAGDMGYLDEDGYLFLTDRKRDMIISGGVNIYPAEVESVICDFPKVADCAVFGIPNEEFGESVAAVVQLVPGGAATDAELQEFLRDRIAGYKIPRRVDFCEALPRDDAGKIRKRDIRAPYWRDATRNI